MSFREEVPSGEDEASALFLSGLPGPLLSGLKGWFAVFQGLLSSRNLTDPGSKPELCIRKKFHFLKSAAPQ